MKDSIKRALINESTKLKCMGNVMYHNADAMLEDGNIESEESLHLLYCQLKTNASEIEKQLKMIHSLLYTPEQTCFWDNEAINIRKE